MTYLRRDSTILTSSYTLCVTLNCLQQLPITTQVIELQRYTHFIRQWRPVLTPAICYRLGKLLSGVRFEGLLRIKS